MKIKLNSYKLLFRLLDILSNSKWLHKLVVNCKIYLGASIISLSMGNSSCTSSKMGQKGDSSLNNQSNEISERKKENIISDDNKLDSTDTIKEYEVTLCYKPLIIEESQDNNANDSIINNITKIEKTSFLSSNEIDYNGTNTARIDDFISISHRPKETANISGTVFVEVIIKIYGRIKDVRIQKGIHPQLDLIAMNALEDLGYWVWPSNFISESDINYVIPIKFMKIEN